MSDSAAFDPSALLRNSGLAHSVQGLVSWSPWGPDSLERATRENKPLLVHVREARSRTCYKLEGEVFADTECAALMNTHFVCVLVDREESPELDTWFVSAALTLNGSVEWPLSVFCTPEPVAPFLAVTALSAADQRGRLGFRTLLGRVLDLWQTDSSKLFHQASELAERLKSQATPPAPKAVTAALLDRAAQLFSTGFDKEHGGFGSAPKQPHCQLLHFLMRRHQVEPNLELLKVISQSLDSMKSGALRDALQGGFFSTCNAADWQAPRFEQTLANNAQLALLYLEAFQLTQNTAYREVAFETLDFALAHLQDLDGGFVAARFSEPSAADGAYFVFNTRELRAALEPEETRVFCAYYGVVETPSSAESATPVGVAALSQAVLDQVFQSDASPGQLRAEGSALTARRDKKSLAKELGLSLDEFETLLHRARDKALFLRKQRAALCVIDGRQFTAWNALIVSALSQASLLAWNEPERAAAYRTAAEGSAKAWLAPEVPLPRVRNHGAPDAEGTLEDYACVSAALLDLYEVSGAPSYFLAARAYGERLTSAFFDRTRGVFHLTQDAEALANQSELRPTYYDTTDATRPKPGSQAARALYRLSLYTGEADLRRAAESFVRTNAASLERSPQHHPSTLLLAHDLLTPALELSYHARDTAEIAALQQEVANRYLPQRAIHWLVNGETPPWLRDASVAEPSNVSTPSLSVRSSAASEQTFHTPLAARRGLESVQVQSNAARSERLTPAVVQGYATRVGTQRYLKRHALSSTAQRELGELCVSRVGFGMQRVSDANPKHREALRLALQNGCNLIETAPAYGAGASARAAFNVLTELFESNALARDEVCVVAKLGVLQPEARRTAAATTESKTPAASLAPLQLQKQLEQILNALNLESLDVCLLHNPELLLPSLSREALLSQLTAAFGWLEQTRKLGRIREYGVASSVLHKANSPISLDLIEQARALAGVGHGRVLSLPYNVLEREAATEEVLSKAAALGYAVLTQRPLQAIREGKLTRLAMPRTVAAGASFSEAQRELAKLEHEFRSQLGAVLRAVPGVELPVDRFFLWSERITPELFSDRERWDEFEQNVLAKELPGLLSAMEASFKPTQLVALWRSWRERYTDGMESLVVAARREGGERSSALNAPLFHKLRELAPKALQHASLAQFALWFASSTEGVTTTLIGMRQPDYVVEATATLRWPEWSAPEEWDESDCM